MIKNAIFLETFLPERDGDPPLLFPGGVPPLEIFGWQFNNLSNLVASFEYNFLIWDNTVELCLIGLISYFEAFCKNQFASTINICPRLLPQLKKNGHDVMVDAAHLALLKDDMDIALGSLIAEKYNFGTAKLINSHYQALLKITPFSKDEIERYDQILNDRNLLVHHGGIYTVKYAEQNASRVDNPLNAYGQSLEIAEDEYFESALLIVQIAAKIAIVTQKVLSAFIATNNIKLTDEQNVALQMLSLPLEIKKVTAKPDRKKNSKRKEKETNKRA